MNLITENQGVVMPIVPVNQGQVIVQWDSQPLGDVVPVCPDSRVASVNQNDQWSLIEIIKKPFRSLLNRVHRLTAPPIAYPNETIPIGPDSLPATASPDAIVEWPLHLRVPNYRNYNVVQDALPPIEISSKHLENCNLIDVIESPVHSLADLHYLAAHAEVKLTFWGARYLSVNGYKCTAHIDNLAGRVIEWVRLNPDFNEAERAHGKSLAKKIVDIYSQSDRQVMGSNFFTRILTAFRDFHFSGFCNFSSFYSSTIRHQWLGRSQWGIEPGFQEIFECYTKQQFQTVLGRDPTVDFRSWYASDLGSKGGPYWKVPQQE
jgi:hypothetical protein